MPYKYDKDKKFWIKTKEDLLYIKKLLDSGETEGSLRNKLLLGRNILKMIKNDWISFDEKISCPITGKLFSYVTEAHAKKLGYKSREDFVIKTGCKMTTFKKCLDGQKAGSTTILTEESKEKIKQANLGKKHSEEAKNKMSEACKGDKNPAKNIINKLKIRKNHWSKKDPVAWEEFKEKQSSSQLGVPKTKEHWDKIKEGWLKSSKMGSKSQRLAHLYFCKYFSIFFKTVAFSNDNTPFKPHTDNFSVDISIPLYKICIEWDGKIFHNSIKLGENYIKERSNKDLAKNIILEQNGWKLIRIKDECPNGRNYKKYVIEKCRETIRDKILPLINNKEVWNDWQNEYPIDHETRIKLKDLDVPQKPCLTPGCEKTVSIKSEFGLCGTCKMRSFRLKNKEKEQKPCETEACKNTIVKTSAKTICQSCYNKKRRVLKKQLEKNIVDDK